MLWSYHQIYYNAIPPLDRSATSFVPPHPGSSICRAALHICFELCTGSQESFLLYRLSSDFVAVSSSLAIMMFLPQRRRIPVIPRFRSILIPGVCGRVHAVQNRLKCKKSPRKHVNDQLQYPKGLLCIWMRDQPDNKYRESFWVHVLHASKISRPPLFIICLLQCTISTLKNR